MTNEKMREEFEAWHVMNCSAICPHVGSEYKAWVASRESLVIDLPSPAVAGSSCIREHAIRDCLESAGLKVKL